MNSYPLNERLGVRKPCVKAYEFEKRFQVVYLHYPTLSSQKSVQALKWQRAWGVQESFPPSKRGEYLEKLWEGEGVQVEIQKVNEKIGLGAFTQKKLKAGEFVGTYTGKIRRIYPAFPDHNAYCLHYPSLLSPWNLWVIDGKDGGNETRFFNHRDQPNLELECLIHEGIFWFFFTAKREVKEGEELTFDYGKAFWQYREKEEAD